MVGAPLPYRAPLARSLLHTAHAWSSKTVENNSFFNDTAALEMHRKAGVRAIQSTPMESGPAPPACSVTRTPRYWASIVLSS